MDITIYFDFNCHGFYIDTTLPFNKGGIRDSQNLRGLEYRLEQGFSTAPLLAF